VVVLGLTRVADDEVGPEGRIGRGRPDGVDARQEAVPVAPAAHPTQQGHRHVLQGEVEVGHAGVEDRLDQVVGEVGRVQVQQAHPWHTLGDRPHEGHDGPLPRPWSRP